LDLSKTYRKKLLKGI